MKLATFIFFACLSNCFAIEKLSNIDYLGTGYDSLRGDPHSDLKDPGFRRPVILLTYNLVSFFLLLLETSWATRALHVLASPHLHFYKFKRIGVLAFLATLHSLPPFPDKKFPVAVVPSKATPHLKCRLVGLPVPCTSPPACTL